MGKENRRGDSGWMQSLNWLLKVEMYKRSQGRLVRQFTCLAIWVAVVVLRIMGVYYFHHNDRLQWHRARPRGYGSGPA